MTQQEFEAWKAEQARMEKIAAEIEKKRAASKQIIDPTLPMQATDPAKEWIYPGHSGTHDPGREDHVVRLGKMYDDRIAAAPTEDQKKSHAAERSRVIASLPHQPRQERKLFRKHHIINVDGVAKCIYTMVWRFGHRGDVFHCYPKDQWTKDQADKFHDDRIAHPAWNGPPPNLQEYHAAIKQQFSALAQKAINQDNQE